MKRTKRHSAVDCVQHDHTFVTIAKIHGAFTACWTNRGEAAKVSLHGSQRFKDIGILTGPARREWAREKSRAILAEIMEVRCPPVKAAPPSLF